MRLMHINEEVKIMPWTKDDFPPSLKNLKPVVRKKAIEIANALKEDGYNDQRSISIATHQAEEWFKKRHQDESVYDQRRRDD